MENYIDIDKFNENLTKEEDKIIEEKSYIFDQIKKLEFEEILLKNNLKFFVTYVNLVESRKSDININDFNLKQKSNDRHTSND